MYVDFFKDFFKDFFLTPFFFFHRTGLVEA